nr:AmmeMemoRadiSam system protein B [Alkalidesulfovibrio alkalitolerans]
MRKILPVEHFASRPKEDDMDRTPIVAGQFYPGQSNDLERMIVACATGAGEADMAPALLTMVPHAGYVYSGQVCGRTLAQANLPDLLVLLGPSHTGRGAPLAVWPDGVWELPGGGLPVDTPLAAHLAQMVPGFSADTAAHLGEHSLEVVLPFLRHFNNATRIVPVAVAARDKDALIQAGKGLAKTLAAWPERAAIVVSSDMSHYLPEDKAKERDALALENVLAIDPVGLYDTVIGHGISMCGVLPMTLGLAAVEELGATSARIAAYATSGDATGDHTSVVGYAGVIIT